MYSAPDIFSTYENYKNKATHDINYHITHTCANKTPEQIIMSTRLYVQRMSYSWMNWNLSLGNQWGSHLNPCWTKHLIPDFKHPYDIMTSILLTNPATNTLYASTLESNQQLIANVKKDISNIYDNYMKRNKFDKIFSHKHNSRICEYILMKYDGALLPFEIEYFISNALRQLSKSM